MGNIADMFASSVRQSVEPPPELSFPLVKISDIEINQFDWDDEIIQLQIPTDILLVTANDHEFRACYSYMEQVQQSWSNDLGIVYFGRFRDLNQNDQNQNAKVTSSRGEKQKAKVALMKCRQGPCKALTAVSNAATILNPRVVIFVGSCGTMQPTKAKLGDVVISAKLATYDDTKSCVDGKDKNRGVIANASKKMQPILDADFSWKPPLKDPKIRKVYVHKDALMVSGPELVDDPKRKQKLQKQFPEALGLEMEGKDGSKEDTESWQSFASAMAVSVVHIIFTRPGVIKKWPRHKETEGAQGLFEAASDKEIQWTIIKAVSNFADGSKQITESWQPFASAMAMSVAHNMFTRPAMIEKWPRRRETEGAQDNAIEAKIRKKPTQWLSMSSGENTNNFYDPASRFYTTLDFLQDIIASQTVPINDEESHNIQDDIIDAVLDLLRNKRKSPAEENDADGIFGLHVAHSLRKIEDRRSRELVKLKIQQLLFSAEFGSFGQEP